MLQIYASCKKIEKLCVKYDETCSYATPNTDALGYTCEMNRSNATIVAPKNERDSVSILCSPDPLMPILNVNESQYISSGVDLNITETFMNTDHSLDDLVPLNDNVSQYTKPVISITRMQIPKISHRLISNTNFLLKKSINLCVSNLTDAQAQYLNKSLPLISQLHRKSFILMDEPTEDLDVLVVNVDSNRMCRRTYKYLVSLLLWKEVVSFEWIIDLIDGKKDIFKRYVKGDTNTGVVNPVQKISLLRQKIFTKINFVISKRHISPELSELVCLGGGTLNQSSPNTIDVKVKHPIVIYDYISTSFSVFKK